MGEHRRIVIAGDIHIGMNEPTNWYQCAVHEPFLLAFFDYVQRNASSIDELVLLGDIVDQWAYPPERVPPSFCDIVKANPRILGSRQSTHGSPGALAETLTALDGNVTYLRGSADMNVRFEDLEQIQDERGRTIRMVPGMVYVPSRMQGQVACIHGHRYSFFHTPDFIAMPDSGLPPAYFFTRLASLDALNRLSRGKTVADLPEGVDPSNWGISRDSLVEFALRPSQRRVDLVELVLEVLLENVGADTSLHFVMPDRSRLSVADVVSRFVRIWDRWENNETRFPQELYGSEPGVMALSGTDAFGSLGPFARIVGERFKVIVMGHTHAEHEKESLLSPVDRSLYANVGLMCPSIPSMIRPHRPISPTFVEVTYSHGEEAFQVAIRYLVPDGAQPRVADEALGQVKTVRI